jgi:spore germination protein GerM
MPSIRNTLQSTNFFERMTSRPVTGQLDDGTQTPAYDGSTADGVILVEPPIDTRIPPVPTVPPTYEVLTDEDTPVLPDSTPSADVASGQPATEASPAPARPESEARERSIYFVKIDDSGMVYTSPVKRRITVSTSPLVNTLNLLLQGPTDAEQRQGFTSLIPDGVLIQSVRIASNTAIISFNENFMFNSYGAEGYVAQLRQIIWTATEFPNIQDVQILIEGRRIEFLGESIRIGRPLSRDSL